MTATRLTLVAVVVLITVLAAACSPSVDTQSTRTGVPEEPDISKMEKPVLSETLIRNCQRDQRSSGIIAGELAVDFTLKDTKGHEYSLSTLLTEKPVVMVFGSFT